MANYLIGKCNISLNYWCAGGCSSQREEFEDLFSHHRPDGYCSWTWNTTVHWNSCCVLILWTTKEIWKFSSLAEWLKCNIWNSNWNTKIHCSILIYYMYFLFSYWSKIHECWSIRGMESMLIYKQHNLQLQLFHLFVNLSLTVHGSLTYKILFALYMKNISFLRYTSVWLVLWWLSFISLKEIEEWCKQFNEKTYFASNTYYHLGGYI